MDIALSLSTLMVLSPLMAVIAVLVKLTSPGPVFYRQERCGLNGGTFKMLKFRSMRVDAEQQTGAVWAQKDDPRRTPLGRFLRSTSLDELPQLINVLKGEMSLVGPRPPLPYEFACYREWHRRRVLEVKPGLTGLWQVYGRCRTTFEDMVRLDLRYARQWSLWLDLKILFHTPAAVIQRNGAY
jgi:exopolysaccharide biosynthesis polyprenyl glycosylphosphotransferase